MGSEPFGKFSTLLDSSTAYKNADSHHYDPFCSVLNMELLQFYCRKKSRPRPSGLCWLTHCVHFAATKVDWVAATCAFTFCRVSRVARSSLLNTEAARFMRDTARRGHGRCLGWQTERAPNRGCALHVQRGGRFRGADPTFPVAPVPNWSNREFPSVAVSPDGNVVSPIRPSSILAGRIRQSRRL